MILRLAYIIALVLLVCGCEKSNVSYTEKNNVGEFITIKVDTTTYTWTTPIGGLVGGEDTTVGYNAVIAGVTDYTGVVRFVRPGNIQLPGTIEYSSVPISIYTNSSYTFNVPPSNIIGDYTPYQNPQPPIITEFGSVGQYVGGNFSGSFIQKRNNFLDTVFVRCSFRVLRTR